MNQVTNKIPYGLLNEEEQAEFCVEARKRGMYENWCHPIFRPCINDDEFQIGVVYRLIIKDDEWYYIELNEMDEEGRVIHGANIGNLRSCYTVRPATAEEIEAAKPQELTLEEKVKAMYPDYEVCMFYWDTDDTLCMRTSTSQIYHTCVQSMKGFYRYVYQHLDGNLDTCTSPTMQWARDESLQPIAVLFTRDK